MSNLRFYWRIPLAAVLLLSAPVASAAISNGASAIDALGQYDDSLSDPQPVYTKSTVDNGPNKLGFNQPYGAVTIDSVNNRLFVSECVNNRVLVFNLNTDHTLADHIPDFVLGQENFYSNASGTTASSLSCPMGSAYDAANNLLFVADHSNDRVLVYNASTISNGMAATYALGQPDLTTTTNAATQSGMSNPWGVSYDGTGSLLYVGDRDNNRVLVFSGAITTGMNAWRVLGQASFTASGSAATQAGMNAPRGVSFGGGYVFVADTGNNRVLVFTGSTLENGMDAHVVIGQTTFTASSGARTQNRLNSPGDVFYDIAGNRLFVADSTNQRVLLFSGSTLATGMNAHAVLGQTSYTAGSAANTQAGFSSPRGVMHDPVSGYLYVTQASNHRISIFDAASITNGESAIDLLGQYDDDLDDPQPVYTKREANNAPNAFGLSLNSVAVSQPAVDEVNHRLFVPDTFNDRVLVYNLNADNELENRIPDYVLGQENFYTSNNGCSSDGLAQPNGVAYDPENNRLFVSSTTASRIVVYDVTSITSGEDAVHVLGSTSFDTCSSSTSQSKFTFQRGLAFDSTHQRLFVAESQRVMIFTFTGGTITDGMNASHVLGQTSFTANSALPISASTFGSVYGVALDESGQRLFVGDSTNSRVLVFDVSTIADGEDAVNVLGPSDFTSTAPTMFSTSRGMAYDSNNYRLFVAGLSHHRVLVFDVASIVDGEDPVYALGQNDLVTKTAATTQSGLTNPQGVAYEHTNDRLYVADRANNRIMVFDVAPVVAAASSSSSTSSTVTQSGGGRRNTQDLIRRALQRIEETTESSSSSSSENDAADGTFSDVPASSWFASFVQTITDLGIVSGYEDADGNLTGAFGPADPVTVGQTIKISLLAADHELPIPAGIPMNPTATDWSAPYIALAESLNFTLASSDVKKNATRGEVMQALLEAFDIEVDVTDHTFTDLSANHPHTSAIATALALGIVTGDTDAEGNPLNTVRPDDTINRAEVAALVVRMLERE